MMEDEIEAMIREGKLTNAPGVSRLEKMLDEYEYCENCGKILTEENKAYYNKEQSIGACEECVLSCEASPIEIYNNL